MRFGLSIALTDQSIRPDAVARLAEAAGFESLFVTEHTHVPSAPQHGSAALPEAYRRTLDPLVALTAAAAASTSLRLGTSVMLAAQHEPLVTAKAVASLDLLSGGRVELGVGGGWLEQELRNHGVDPARRFARLREHVEAMRVLWREEVASFDGEHVRFDRVWSWPKPLQAGGPPVLIGGDGPRVLERVLAYGDGWLPRAPAGLDALLPRVAELGRLAEQAGRPRPSVTLYNAPTAPASVARCRDAGIERGLIRLPSAGADEVEAAIEQAAAALARGG